MLTFDRADRLPGAWDELCGENYAARIGFLKALEAGNPCGQRYHLFEAPGGRPDSLLITYRSPRQNLMLFTPFYFPAPVTFVHVPVSVTRPGLVLGAATEGEVLSFIRGLKGYVIVLNAPAGMRLEGFARGRTASQLRLPLRWKNFEDYLGAQRSHYRYRHRKSLQRGRPLIFEFLTDTGQFDESLHRLYKNVHSRSRVRIERQGIEFFRRAPARILVARLGKSPVGFTQLIENGKELVFEFVGLDYRHNQTFEVYHNLLLKMVEYGINRGFQVLELGQTAEDAKLRLGGELAESWLLMGHSNRWMNRAVNAMLPWIQYRPPALRPEVFKPLEAGA
jgi:hypothetical protein